MAGFLVGVDPPAAPQFDFFDREKFVQALGSEGLQIFDLLLLAGVLGGEFFDLASEFLGLDLGDLEVFFETDFFPKLAALNQLSAFVFQGVWFDVSDPESYASAQARWEDI